MRVTIAQLGLLLAVVRAGSVGAAARQLGMTQSGASQAIIALEKALGVELVTRTREGVTPTAFTLAILQDAEIASEAVDRIVVRAREAASASGGALRVASVPSVASRLLPAWSRSFRQLYPETELSIFEGDHVEIGQWVSGGIADVGLTAVPPSGLRAEYVQDEELVVVVPREHALLRTASVAIEDLAGTVLVIAGHGCEPLMERLFVSAGQPVPRIVRASDVTAAMSMVRQGIGLTILPETALPPLGLVDLRVRRLSPHAHRQLYMVTLPESESSAVARFARIVKADHLGTIGHQQR